MRYLAVFVAIGLTLAEEGPCFSHVTVSDDRGPFINVSSENPTKYHVRDWIDDVAQDNCDTVSAWSAGSCNSVYGGFRVSAIVNNKKSGLPNYILLSNVAGKLKQPAQNNRG